MDEAKTVLKPRDERYRNLLARKNPELAIKLSRVYEFGITGSDTDLRATLKAGDPIADNSYISAKYGHPGTQVSHRVNISNRLDLDLPPGVTIVIGRSGSGKTKFTLNTLTLKNDNVMYVRHGEPLDHRFVMHMNTNPERKGISLLDFEVDVAARIASFLFEEGSDVLVIDSLRYLFYAGGGATGKGGVNMTLFADISYLDVVASRRGKSLVVVINPLTDDDDSYRSIIEAAKGSVSGLIDMLSPSSFRYTSRYAEREFKSFSIPEEREDNQVPGGQKLQAKSDVTISLKSLSR